MTRPAPSLTQAIEPPQPKPKRAWGWVAPVVVVGALIVGELAFQWARHGGCTTYTAADGLADNDVNAIAVTTDGVLWVGTYGGVSRFDGRTWTTYTEDDGLANKSVSSIAVAPDGTVWVGTWGDGVSCFDGETWTTHTAADGLAHNNVYAIAVAPDGAVWFGTRGGGLSRFDGAIWTTYTEDDGLASNRVMSIAVAPDGVTWVGTYGGVSRFDGETWTTYTAADGLEGGAVKAIEVAPDGALWFGTWFGGISRFDGEIWTTYATSDGLANNAVTSIAVAPDSALWFGNWDGIFRFDGAGWNTDSAINPGLADDHVQALAIDDQSRVWMGTADGLSVLDERMSLAAKVLQAWAQVWSALRILGIGASVLLAIVCVARLVRRRNLRLWAVLADSKTPLMAGAVWGAVVLGLIGGVVGTVLPRVSLFMLYGSGHGGLAGTDTVLEWVCEALLAPGRVFCWFFPAGTQWEFGWGNVLGYGIIGALIGAWLGVGVSLRRDRGTSMNSNTAQPP